MAKGLFDLEGHVALITGGNGGIGLAMAKGLVRCGAQVAIWGRDPVKNAAALAELAELGGFARAYVADVLDPEATKAAFAQTIADFGTISSCFANAGGPGVRGAFADLNDAGWDAAVALNLGSVVRTFRLARRYAGDCGVPRFGSQQFHDRPDSRARRRPFDFSVLTRCSTGLNRFRPYTPRAPLSAATTHGGAQG